MPEKIIHQRIKQKIHKDGKKITNYSIDIWEDKEDIMNLDFLELGWYILMEEKNPPVDLKNLDKMEEIYGLFFKPIFLNLLKFKNAEIIFHTNDLNEMSLHIEKNGDNFKCFRWETDDIKDKIKMVDFLNINKSSRIISVIINSFKYL